MTKAVTLVRTAAPVTTLASRQAAPANLATSHALKRHVPDMARGFTIVTRYGEMVVEPGPTADRIAALVAEMLRAELAGAAQAQGGQHEL